MILNIKDLHKTLGNKNLFNGLSLHINEGEKVALIGRNGLGKSTLFKILAEEDTDYEGEFEKKKDIKVIYTVQEHFFDDNLIVLQYILKDIPYYLELKNIIDSYPTFMAEDIQKIDIYTEAIGKFSELGYYFIEEQILYSLESFGLNIDQMLSSFNSLSGGEKRFVELVRIMYSAADVMLIDEPTNHMDYVGKENFIKWMDTMAKTVFVITHDRDVLSHVDKIIEIKDKKSFAYKGNYDAYLNQNSLTTVTQIKTYEDSLKMLDKLHGQMIQARIRKMKANSPSARIMEERFERQYNSLKESLRKPSFWIDKETMEAIDDTVIDTYHKYKDKNITIVNNQSNEYKKELLAIRKISLGYDHPLFKEISFTLQHGERIMLKGRNGVGKSTLIHTIVESILQQPYSATIFEGEIKFDEKVRLGVYEQEISTDYLDLTLEEAITKLYLANDLIINNQLVSKLLSQYLFNPSQDKDLKIQQLSGGQKARFQIISMLCNKPNLLILDEPTNHLDLPSIEELESSLVQFAGAILYVSHDTYFQEQLAGEIIEIK